MAADGCGPSKATNRAVDPDLGRGLYAPKPKARISDLEQG
jgi:hypothetical protein